MRKASAILDLREALHPLAVAHRSYVISGAQPTQQQRRMISETLTGCVDAIDQARADLAALPGSQAESLPAPYTGCLQADIGLMADAMSQAAAESEAVDGLVLVGFALALRNLAWRAQLIESLLGIAPKNPTPPISPASLRALAQLSGGRIAA